MNLKSKVELKPNNNNEKSERKVLMDLLEQS